MIPLFKLLVAQRSSTRARFARQLPALCLPLAFLGACGTTEKAPAPPPALIQKAGSAAITVTEADAGAPIVLERGQLLVVRLAVAGNQNPDWVVIDLKPGVLRALGSRFELVVSDGYDYPNKHTGWPFQNPPAWQAYVAKVRELIFSQDTRIMKCAPFFLERLRKMLAATR